jgi:hypothetical protein
MIYENKSTFIDDAFKIIINPFVECITASKKTLGVRMYTEYGNARDLMKVEGMTKRHIIPFTPDGIIIIEYRIFELDSDKGIYYIFSKHEIGSVSVVCEGYSPINFVAQGGWHIKKKHLLSILL